MNEIQGDELFALLKVSKYRFLEATRPRYDRSPLPSRAQLLPALIPAACKARLLLEGGAWVKTTELRRIAQQNRISPSCVLEFLPVCESDRGLYIALPGPQTPETAPDEL